MTQNEYKALKLENRIHLLSNRTGKENQRIINKLMRQLRQIKEQ